MAEAVSASTSTSSDALALAGGPGRGFSASMTAVLRRQLDFACGSDADAAANSHRYPTELMWLCALPGECQAIDHAHKFLMDSLRDLNPSDIEDIVKLSSTLGGLDSTGPSTNAALAMLQNLLVSAGAHTHPAWGRALEDGSAS